MNGPDKHHMAVVEIDAEGWHVCNGCKASGPLDARPAGVCPTPWLDRPQLLDVLATRTAWMDRLVAYFTESGMPEDLLAEYKAINAGDALPKRQPQNPQAQLFTPIQVTAVAVTRADPEEGLELDWLLEGGIAALELPGAVLLVADGVVTNDEGNGTVYSLARIAEVRS